jgi:hypothetical protein
MMGVSPALGRYAISDVVAALRRGAQRAIFRHYGTNSPYNGWPKNLVKAHKRHLASDRTSCSKASANQFRLVLHTAAYWLLHTLRGLCDRTAALPWNSEYLTTLLPSTFLRASTVECVKLLLRAIRLSPPVIA